MARDNRIVPKAIVPRLLPKKYLADGEYLFFESRQHRTVWLKLIHRIEWLIGIDIVIYFLIPLWPWLDHTSSPYIQYYQGTIEPFFFVLNLYGLMFWPMRWLNKRSVVYAVTNRRVIRKSGILFKSHKDVPLSEIDDIDIDWGPVQRAMDFGKLEFRTAKVKHGHVKFKEKMEWIAVPGPAAVRRLVLELGGKEVPAPGHTVRAVRPGVARTAGVPVSMDSEAATPSS